MRRNCLLGLLFLSCATASQHAPSTSPSASPPSALASSPLRVQGSLLPARSEIAARMNSTIATHTSRPGELVSATIESPVLETNGRALVRRGDKVILRVDAVDPGRGLNPARLVATPVAIHSRCRLEFRERLIEGRAHLEANLEDVPAEAHTGHLRAAGIGGFWTGALFGIPFLGLGLATGSMAHAVGEERVDVRIGEGALVWIRFDDPVTMSALTCPREAG